MPALQPDLIVGSSNQYRLVEKIGEGGHAEVYKAIDVRDNTAAALKFVRRSENFAQLRKEYEVLVRLKDCHGISRVIDIYEGKPDDTQPCLSHISLELLGSNLFDHKKQVGVFNPKEFVSFGVESLESIKQIHENGFIHRDVKPANFAQNCQGKWTLLDFGLAKKYNMDKCGAHISMKYDVGFRGSTQYASVHAHTGMELSRRDDLWSWFYMLIEQYPYANTLPWRVYSRSDQSKDQIHLNKMKCMENAQLYFRGIPAPAEFVQINLYLSCLSFDDSPDYQKIQQLVCGMHNSLYRCPWQQSVSPGKSLPDNSQPSLGVKRERDNDIQKSKINSSNDSLPQQSKRKLQANGSSQVWDVLKCEYPKESQCAQLLQSTFLEEQNTLNTAIKQKPVDVPLLFVQTVQSYSQCLAQAGKVLSKDDEHKVKSGVQTVALWLLRATDTADENRALDKKDSL